MNLDDKLERVVARHDELGDRWPGTRTPGSADYTRLAKEYADLDPVVEKVRGAQAGRAKGDRPT